MCYMAAIPLVMTAVSAVASAYGNYQQTKAQNANLEYNRQVQLQNAAMVRQEASYARSQAQRNANEKRKENAALIGAQRARMGASGAVVDSGSFLDLTLSTREEGEKDAVGLLQQGDMEAWRHDVRAGQFDEQARVLNASKQDAGAVLAGGLLTAAAKTGASYFAMGDFMGSTTSAASGFSAEALGFTADRAYDSAFNHFASSLAG